MYYIIDGDENNKFESVDDVCEYIFDPDNYDDDDAVEAWINESYNSVTIGGWDFEPGEIVRECNSSAFSDFCQEWAEYQAENDRDYYYNDVENLEPGEEEWIGNYKVKCVEENEEEDEDIDAIEEFNNILDVAMVIKTVSDNPVNVQMIK